MTSKKQALLQQITGNLGKDPEIRETKIGDVVSFSVAVTLKYGEDGITRWVQVTVFDERQEDDRDDELSPLQQRVMDGLEKGSKVAVEGRISSRDVDGKTYYDMVATRIGVVEWFKRGEGDSSSRRPSRSSSRKASTRSKREEQDDEDDEDLGW